MKPKKKKNKQPVTAIKLSTNERKKIISELHQINKKKSLLAKTDLTETEKSVQKKKLDEKISKIGGLNAYQFVSKTTEDRYGGFNTAKWVMQQLHKHDVMIKRQDRKLELLDVGALSLNYTQHAQLIQATAIDLNPQKTGILKADLLKYKAGEQEQYDVVVLSLVLNFAGDPAIRGEIWRRACQLCRLEGHLVTVFPRPCVFNSRYLTNEMYVEMVESLGLSVVSQHCSKKLAFHMLKKVERNPKSRSFSKVQQRSGPGLNNFCITLK